MYYYSDLELLVHDDMWSIGLQPGEPEDIKLYWEIMLGD